MSRTHFLSLCGFLLFLAACDQHELDTPASASPATDQIVSGNVVTDFFVLSGSVFVNADDDPHQAANELGIGDVLVEVYDGPSLIESTLTDSLGNYSFTLPASQLAATNAYVVRIPETAEDAFNEVLYESYDYVRGGIAQTRVVLTEDKEDVSAGFVANPEDIVFELTEGDFRTAARAVDFWRIFLRQITNGVPCSHGPPGTDCEAEVRGFLEIILDDAGDPTDPFYLLPVPFELPVGVDPIEWAFDELRSTPATTMEAILQKTLAAELSRHANIGSPDPAYDDAFFSYIEEWISNNSVAGGIAGTGGSPEHAGPGDISPEDVELMLDAYLRGGGGGPIID